MRENRRSVVGAWGVEDPWEVGGGLLASPWGGGGAGKEKPLNACDRSPVMLTRASESRRGIDGRLALRLGGMGGPKLKLFRFSSVGDLGGRGGGALPMWSCDRLCWTAGLGGDFCQLGGRELLPFRLCGTTSGAISSSS